MNNETIKLTPQSSDDDVIRWGLTTAWAFYNMANQPPAEMVAEFEKWVAPDLRADADDPRAWLLQHASEAAGIAQKLLDRVLADSPPPRGAAKDEVALAFDTPDDDEFYLEFHEVEVH